MIQDIAEFAKLCTVMPGNNQTKNQDVLANGKLADTIDNASIPTFVLRQLTYKYTCPLTVLYGAERAGN